MYFFCTDYACMFFFYSAGEVVLTVLLCTMYGAVFYPSQYCRYGGMYFVHTEYNVHKILRSSSESILVQGFLIERIDPFFFVSLFISLLSPYICSADMT